MCELSGQYELLFRTERDVIALSVDTPFAQEAWAQKEKINLTLASDLNKKRLRSMTWFSRCWPGRGHGCPRRFRDRQEWRRPVQRADSHAQRPAQFRQGQRNAGQAEVVSRRVGHAATG